MTNDFLKKSKIKGTSTMTQRMTIQVECYAGYRGEQAPLAFTVGDRRVEVKEVLDQWLAPDHRYFRVRGHDGGLYILRHDVDAAQWEITLSGWKR